MLSCKTNKLFLFFILWLNIALSQNFPGNHYTASNKLPNNTVRSIFIDSEDILWIGTDNGVVKKENDIFKNFFAEDGLALNSCWAIAEDKNNNMWFGSYGGGVSIYDGAKFKVISEREGLAHNEITRLFPYNNYMFAGTSDGVSRIDINTLKVDSWKIPTEEELIRITGFFEYQDQVYIATYNTGIYKLNREKEQLDMVKVNDHQFIYSIFIDNDNIYSNNKGFFTKNELAGYVQKEYSVSSKKLGHSIIWDHVKTTDNKIFTAAWGIYDTNGGVYELKNDELISRASDFNISSKKIVSIAYDDKFERLYVGTLDVGLFEVQLNSLIKFHKMGGKNVLGFARTKSSSALLVNDGILLKKEGIKHKISLIQLKKWQRDYISKTKLPLPKHEDSFYELDYTTQAEEISFYDIKVSEEMYWVNTNIGIFVINTLGKLVRYIPLHSEEINFTENGLLIETHPYGGIRIYSDLDTLKYTHYKKEDFQTPTMVVNSLREKNKTYLLSVFSGLYVWENDKFTSYLENDIWQEHKLRHITNFGKNLAISNEFGDVFIINDSTSFEILEKVPRAKIEGNTIAFLKEYKGYLIIGTEKGLTFFKDGRFIFLDEEQGLKQPLLSAEVSQNNLSLGARGGFYTIHLDAVINSTTLIDELNIKEVYINNQKAPLERISNEKEIKLAHDENTILVKFSTNTHPYPKKLTYQYRLNKEEGWSPPDSKPEIFLPFLPSKDYHVSIKVSDSSTGLNYTQFLTKLSILPPFWKTWWFALLILSSILLITSGIYKYQIRQHKEFENQKSLIQKRFEETKMEALLAQMNPHFIFNAMNSIQNYIMDSDVDNASVFLGDFAKLIRLNLDHCTKPTILLVEEIEYLQSYIRVENTRFNNSVNVIFETDPAIDLYNVEIPTMLLQTFVENVFVHAFPQSIKNPTLEISFESISKDILQCKIKDNGIGYSASSGNSLHQSKGINLISERLKLLGYDVEDTLQITSIKNKGTKIILRLQA